jgi:hypothetical protein
MSDELRTVTHALDSQQVKESSGGPGCANLTLSKSSILSLVDKFLARKETCNCAE